MTRKRAIKTKKPAIDKVGLVGLGMMGRGIATCLLIHGIEVVAYNRTASRRRATGRQIGGHIDEVVARKLRTRSQVRGWRRRLTLTGKIEDLADCPFIIETVHEDLDLKHRLYDQIEDVVGARTVIASNTSAFPASLLQKGRKHPERFLVMHWAEP
ncbi:MAG: 3-hydroxyacyl-CoA dehydrogenase family protein, partial [Planctomycetota bacterium]